MRHMHTDEEIKNLAGDSPAVKSLDDRLETAEGKIQTIEQAYTTIPAVTALIEGGTISNAKPIYYHPVVLYGKSDGDHRGDAISLVVLSNNSEAFTLASFIQWIESNHITYLAPASGSVYSGVNRYIVAWIDVGYSGDTISQLLFRGHGVSSGSVYLEQIAVAIADIESDYSLGDGVNKVN